MSDISDKIILRNLFNGETFIFGPEDTSSAFTSFDVVLEPGGSGGGNALVHVHPMATEVFHVYRGCLEVVVGKTVMKVHRGQSATIPKGEPHYFRNGGDGQVEMAVEFHPKQRHRDFFLTFAQLTETRPQWFTKSGDPKFLLIALFLHTYQDHLYLYGVPLALQRRLFSVLAPVARFFGYSLAPYGL